MLVDQALHSLPEVLCGGAYPRHDHEGGLVTALAMAVLQELNGRNVANPLACLQTEKLYWPKASAASYGGRHLRADLCVRLSDLRVGNDRIQTYGWRLLNWLEAKFFRDEVDRTKPASRSGNATKHSANLLADLVRLSTLVAETPPSGAGTKPWLTRNGRYLLHVYDSEPRRYVALKKYKTKDSPKSFTREWLNRILTSGSQSVTIKDLGDEGEQFRKAVGTLSDLELDLQVTNRLVYPTTAVTGVKGQVYWCHLTRIDAVTAKLRGAAFTIGDDRTVKETAAGDFEKIRRAVAAEIGIPEGAADDQAPADDDEAPLLLGDVQVADTISVADDVQVELEHGEGEGG